MTPEIAGSALVDLVRADPETSAPEYMLTGAGLDLTVTAVLPTMTPFGEVGRLGVRGYAARGGQTEEAYLQQLGELLTPEMAGSALVELVRADPAITAPGYLLTAAGLQRLP